MLFPRPAKTAACAHLADLLTTRYDYPADLAARLSTAVVDPSDVRRRLSEGTYRTTTHGVLALSTTTWLTGLTPVYAGFDFRVMRNGGRFLSGPDQPPALSETSPDRDVDEGWTQSWGHYPDNRSFLVDALTHHRWVWGTEDVVEAMPLLWTASASDLRAGVSTPAARASLTVLSGSEVLYSARDLLVDRLRSAGARESDLSGLMTGQREGLRRVVDLAHATMSDGDYADPAWLLVVPTTVYLAVPTTSGGYTATGLADAVRADLVERDQRARAQVTARFRRGEHVHDPAALARGRAASVAAVGNLAAIVSGLARSEDPASPSVRPTLARLRATNDWMVAPVDQGALTYRCAQHAALPRTCTCPAPNNPLAGPSATSGTDAADSARADVDLATDEEDPYDPLCLEHGEVPDVCDRGADSGCLRVTLDPRWATKVAWAARLVTHPATRQDSTPAAAADTLAAFVDTYIGFDSPATVEQVAALVTPEVWDDHAVEPQLALTALHGVVHQPVDGGVNPATDFTDMRAWDDDALRWRDYVTAHLVGMLALIEHGYLSGVSGRRVAALSSALYRHPHGRRQIADFAAAALHRDMFDETPTLTMPAVRLLGTDGEQVRDEFDAADLATPRSFQRTWLPLITGAHQ